MDLPFDGAISRYFHEGAPKAVRKSIESAGKDDILTAGYPYRERMAKKDYEAQNAALQIQLVRLQADVKASGKRLILPSAGIGALDILSSAAVGGLESVTVTVRKDPSAWKGTIAETLVDLDSLKVPHTVFDGPVREGAKLYPQNVNISAAAAIAGIGLDRTRVVIVADPTITTHIVELEAKGAFGRFTFMEDVAVSEENRKTGKLVAMAMVKSVRQLASTLVVAA